MTQRKIFWFWLPLALSWALMTLESPIIQAAIARLPEVETMLAAAGIVISLEVTIESPVIMLLSTSTALAGSPQAYRVVRRFMIHLNILLTIIAAAVAFIDPIYQGLVVNLMGIPPHIAEVAQPAMQVMTLWSAAIGWRRFYQGILIRFDQTRRVGIGTLVRLTSSALFAFGLAFFTDLPGIMVGAYTWMAGVTSEVIYVHWAARPTVAAHLSGPDDPNETPLTYWQVVKYHTPLAATTLLTLLTQPLIGAGLARMLYPEQSLAAWPVIFSIFLFFRSFGMALPEVIIALLKGVQTFGPLRRFSMQVAAGSTLALALVTFTPLITLYLLYVTGIPPKLAEFIIPGVMVGIFIPALQAVQSWLRGILMVGKVTGNIYWGMGLNLIMTVLVIVLGVRWQAPGVPVAALALSLGMLVEVGYLWWRVKPIQARLHLTPDPVALT